MGGEVDSAGDFGDLAPSHPAQTLASFPRSDDFLDPARHPVDRLLPGFELRQRFLFVAAPHVGRSDARNTAWADGLTEMAPAVGAVCEDLTGIVGQRIGARSAAATAAMP